MKRSAWIWVLVMGLALASPMFAGEREKCSADTQTCLNKMASNLKSRGWVGIELDHNDSGQLTVTFVEPDSPAMEAGLREGDVLVAMNGVEFSDENHDRLYAIKKDLRVGKTLTYTVERAGCCHIEGGRSDVEVTLGMLPDQVLAKWVGNHMLEHAVIEVAQN